MEKDLELLFCISFSDLIYYPDKNEDIFFEINEFKCIRDFLQIKINIFDWINQCHRILEGNKKLQCIKLFYSKNKESYILLDNYFDPFDQLDLITIGIKTINKNSSTLKILGRKFFDICEYNISYQEGCSSIRQFYPIDHEALKKVHTKPVNDLTKGKYIRKFYTKDSI